MEQTLKQLYDITDCYIKLKLRKVQKITVLDPIDGHTVRYTGLKKVKLTAWIIDRHIFAVDIHNEIKINDFYSKVIRTGERELLLIKRG